MSVAPFSITREWTHHLPIRMQAVLLGAIRGCDGAPKGDPSKSLLWALRWDILHPDGDNVDPEHTVSFMGYRADLSGSIETFLSSLDQYPFHFVMHVMHAIEILGYKHEDPARRLFWSLIYEGIVTENVHCTPETEAQLDVRLGPGGPRADSNAIRLPNPYTVDVLPGGLIREEGHGS